MKIVEESNLQKNRQGEVKIIPEEQDDLWILSNIIQPNDIVSTETTRKVLAPGSTKNSVKVKFTTDVKITSVNYDSNSCSMRLSGKIITTNSYVISGCFHTLEIEKDKAFVLKKKSWDVNSIEILKDGCNHKVGCDLVVILVSFELANVYLLGKSVTNLCATIDGKIRGKKIDPPKFYEKIMNVVTKNLDGSLQCMVIGGPGSTKNELNAYMNSQSSKGKSMEKLKSRVVMMDVESIGKEGLKEVLCDSKLMTLIKDTKSAVEVKTMKEFNDIMRLCPDKACYGPKSVDIASEMMAIETLLITDELFRNNDHELRKKYIELLNSVKNAGGKAVVFSSMQVSGEMLAQLTGIGAILRFPVPNIDDLEI